MDGYFVKRNQKNTHDLQYCADVTFNPTDRSQSDQWENVLEKRDYKKNHYDTMNKKKRLMFAHVPMRCNRRGSISSGLKGRV